MVESEQSKKTSGTSLQTHGAEDDLQADAELRGLVGDDPITALLLSGEARSVHEAETKFLNENVEFISQKVLELVDSNLSDEELSRHPLILLLRGHGSRRWEDSLL